MGECLWHRWNPVSPRWAEICQAEVEAEINVGNKSPLKTFQ